MSVLLSQFIPPLSSPGGFPGGSDGKESACNTGDSGLIPGLGRSPGGGNRNPCSYSYLENSMDRGDWQDLVHRVAKNAHIFFVIRLDPLG